MRQTRIHHDRGRRQRRAGLVVVSDDDRDGALVEPGHFRNGVDAAVHGDEERRRGRLLRQAALQRAEGQSVPFGVAQGQEGSHLSTQPLQGRDECRGGDNAVDVEVAIDNDAPAGLDG